MEPPLPIVQLTELQLQLTATRIDMWLVQVGHWRWWILFSIFTVPWIIAYKLADRKQLRALTMFTVIVAVAVITLDEIGLSLGLWAYPVDLLPIVPRLTCIDYSGLPVIFMLLYQYFPSWRSYFRALVVFSAAASFLAEPTLARFGLYVPLKWFYWYSFPIYIVLGLVVRWIVRKITDAELATDTGGRKPR